MQVETETTALVNVRGEVLVARNEESAAHGEEEAAMATVTDARKRKVAARKEAMSICINACVDPFVTSQGSAYYCEKAARRRKETEKQAGAAADEEARAVQDARYAGRRKLAARKRAEAAEALVKRMVAAAATHAVATTQAAAGWHGSPSPPNWEGSPRVPKAASADGAVGAVDAVPLPPRIGGLPSQFAYVQHTTASKCVARGCRMRHLSLTEVAKGAGLAFSSLEPTKARLRKAALAGLVRGTGDFYRAGTRGEPPNRTNRSSWWWHEGDPQLYKVRRVIQGLSVEGWP